jgi:TRAP-type C4-dicarboxylate transport system permease small subunit
MSKDKSLYTVLENSINRLSILSGYVSGWVIFGMMLLMTAAVFARRVFGYPLIFSDEYSAYGMVFCVFLGGAYTLLEDAHVRVDILVVNLDSRLRMLLQAMTSCISLFYGITLAYLSAKFVLYYKEIGHRSLSIMETPTWIPALVIPIGMAVLTLQMVLCILREIKYLLGKSH